MRELWHQRKKFLSGDMIIVVWNKGSAGVKNF